MRTHVLSVLVSTVGLVTVSGCLKQEPSPQAAAPPPPPVAMQAPPPAPAPPQMVYLPVGTEMTVRTDSSIGTKISAPGEIFRAKVVEPLTAVTGELVVPAGANVIGRVVDVDQGPVPSMRIQFQSIETTVGTVPFHATIKKDQDGDLALRAEEIRQTALGYDSVLYPGGAAVGGGPTQKKGAKKVGNDIVIPAGAALKMELTTPLAAPASHQPPMQQHGAPYGGGPQGQPQLQGPPPSPGQPYAPPAPQMWPPVEQQPSAPEQRVQPPPLPQDNRLPR